MIVLSATLALSEIENVKTLTFDWNNKVTAYKIYYSPFADRFDWCHLDQKPMRATRFSDELSAIKDCTIIFLQSTKDY